MVRNWTSIVVKWYRDQKMYKRLSWLLHPIFSRILWGSVYSIWNNPQWIYKRSVFWRDHYFPKRKVYQFFLQLILLQNSLGNIGCSLLAGSHMRRRVMVSISYYIFFYLFFYQSNFFFNHFYWNCQKNLKSSFETLNK